MSLCKSGQIVNCCHPNALMTLKEYLEDYASPETRAKGMALIEKEVDKITNPKVKETVIRHLHDMEGGMRDFRFSDYRRPPPPSGCTSPCTGGAMRENPASSTPSPVSRWPWCPRWRAPPPTR